MMALLPPHMLRLLGRPDILHDIRHAQAHPEESVELDLPPAPEDVDWEAP